MIERVIFSKPLRAVQDVFGKPYVRVKIRVSNEDGIYHCEYFTKTQSFHERMTAAAVDTFIAEQTGKTFGQCVITDGKKEITLRTNRHGEVKRFERNRTDNMAAQNCALRFGNNRTKKYLLPEGTPVPFLVALGVMTADGKVRAQKYDKFRQINRFLEFVDDILPAVTAAVKNRPLQIADFGCGKSYLTFAMYHYLTVVKKIPAEIIGLDLKQSVIEQCTELAERLDCKGLTFAVGDIATYHYEKNPDLLITLHACDTATDYALDFAIRKNCATILSVPCCQHEINTQLSSATSVKKVPAAFALLVKYGLLRERFAALATDALRAEYLEAAGYSVQVLEFIDMEHTPKNILLRAVKKSIPGKLHAHEEADALTDALGVTQTLQTLLNGK